MKSDGYRLEIVYLTIPSPMVALRRIAGRVRQGGHNVPAADVKRRFQRSWANFQNIYKPLADGWLVYDNSGSAPRLIDQGPR
jgi:predicted ABC-type ATPase